MRKIIFCCLLLYYLLAALATQVLAQDQYTVYKLISEADNYALTLNKGILTFEAEKQGVNQYNQLFVFRRVAGSSQVYICPAADLTQFLKRENDNVLLASIAEAGDLMDFRWELNFAGISFGVLSTPEDPTQALSRDSGDQVLAAVPYLDADNPTVGQPFRLKLKLVTQTL